MKLGDKVQEDISAIPSGSIGLDAALGVGVTLKEELLKFMVLSHLEKQL